MVASAAAILGVLASDWLLAREDRRGAAARQAVSWLLGAAARSRRRGWWPCSSPRASVAEPPATRAGSVYT